MRKISLVLLTLLILALPTVSARLVLDSVQFDPAIIASGDEVDVVVQFHETSSGDEDKVGNEEYSFNVFLESDDTLTKKYVIIQDTEGNNLRGTIYTGSNYNKVFRVKVAQNAPAGNYEFRLVGQWYYKDVPLESIQFLRFKMPVKKEGIIMDISTLETVPSEVRPGDNYVKVVAFIENSGEKDAKSAEVKLNLPEGLSSSYSNDNRVWVGRVNAGERREVTFYIDVDDKVKPDLFNINYNFNYMDLDNNAYQKSRTIPFRVKSRPYLEVVSYEGEGLSGTTSKLYVTVKNTGTESAESVDVRLLKESSQPFDFDVRSNYVGELEPDEEGTVVFDIKIKSDAEIKDHDFKIIIRSKGDSDEGDDNIYTYNRRAKFSVTGKKPNLLVTYGIAIAVIILIIVAISALRRKKK